MNFRALLITAFAACLAIVGTAQAKESESGWYAGVGLGGTIVDDHLADGISFEDNQFAWKIMGGYRVNKAFWTEIAWVDLGEASDSDKGVSGDIDIQGATFQLFGGYPLGDFLPYVKGGVFVWDAHRNINGIPSIGDGNGEDLFWGIGINYDLGERFGLRLEWESLDMGGFDEELITGGITYHF